MRYAFWLRRGWYSGKRPFRVWVKKHPGLWWMIGFLFWGLVFAFFLWFTIWNIQYLMSTSGCQRHGRC